MFCTLLTLVFSVLGGLVTGCVVAAMLTIPAAFSFFYSQLPLAKFATIETFVEIGLILYLILTRLFRRNRGIKVFAIIIIILLSALAIFISFRSKLILTYDFPIFGNMYKNIFQFFSGIFKTISDFFTGR